MLLSGHKVEEKECWGGGRGDYEIYSPAVLQFTLVMSPLSLGFSLHMWMMEELD